MAEGRRDESSADRRPAHAKRRRKKHYRQAPPAPRRDTAEGDLGLDTSSTPEEAKILGEVAARHDLGARHDLRAGSFLPKTLTSMHPT
jgi:hypothetical protein